MEKMGSNRFALESNTKESSRMVGKSKKGKTLSKIVTLRNAVLGIFLIQLLTLILLVVIINPSLVFEQLEAVKIINRVSSAASVPPSEVPVIARVGDRKLLPDIDELKKQNEVNAQVYKDAKNGDYVLGYSSKLIIFRAEDNKVIYEGDNPQKILQDTQTALIQGVIAKAKERGLIAQDSKETPQVAIVTDVNAVKATDSTFYRNVQQNDILATFTTSSVIVLYRPSTNEIVNSGSVNTTINAL